MEANLEEIRPFRPVSPGEILQDELDARGWTQIEFAEILGKPIQTVNEILSAKKSITAETALLIAQALGTSPEMWMRLEADYRIQKLSNESEGDNFAKRKGQLYSIAPVREMKALGWIKCSRTRGRLTPSMIDEIESRLCQFFEVEQLKDIETNSFSAHFRKSNTESSTAPSIRAWLQKVRLEALQMPAKKFDQTQLKDKISDIVKLSATSGKILPKVRAFLHDLGVTLVSLKHLSKTRLDGAAFWIGEDRPVIGVTHRINRVDNFWFTLMHELAHLILHGSDKNAIFFDEDITGEKADSMEKEANLQAQKWLIDEQAYRKWLETRGSHFTVGAVRRFAEELGIHPAIVVGRMQHEGLLPYTHMRNVLEKVI